MAKASLKLENGTDIVIEGTPDEVQKLLAFYNSSKTAPLTPPRSERTKQSGKRPPNQNSSPNQEDVDLMGIINLIKSCDQAELIEKNILDNKPSQLARVLLPLGVVHDHMDNAFGLSSGEISKVSKELGVPISPANAAHTLAGPALKYVMADRVKKPGLSARYKLSRRGVEAFRSLVSTGKID